VFDFVMTENKKYVIYMDEVFSGGKLIGSIWENTWVITEIIKESLMSTSPVDMLREEASKTVEFVLEGIEWTKETVSQIIKEYHSSGIILEQTYNPFNSDFWSTKNASKIGSKVVDKTKELGNKALSLGKEYASKLMMGAFIPALRWIRRNAMTSVGIVVDVVTAMIPITTGANKLVWAMIVILDLWEIKNKAWRTLEGEQIVKFLQDSGYDGLITQEGSNNNIGIFDPSLIKIESVEEIEVDPDDC
jgi:hypothetical protein